jgi:hypothetical protein
VDRYAIVSPRADANSRETVIPYAGVNQYADANQCATVSLCVIVSLCATVN